MNSDGVPASCQVAVGPTLSKGAAQAHHGILRHAGPNGREKDERCDMPGVKDVLLNPSKKISGSSNEAS